MPTLTTAEYTFVVPSSAAPPAGGPSSHALLYSSSVKPSHIHAGLLGVLVVSRAFSPFKIVSAGVDRELVIVSFVSDENQSPFLRENIATFGSHGRADETKNMEFVESNMLHGINGLLFCNLRGLQARIGERVRIHMLAAGSEMDIHTPMLHSHVAVVDQSSGLRSAVVQLLPGASRVLDFVPDTAGIFRLECGVNDHYAAGMAALLSIFQSS